MRDLVSPEGSVEYGLFQEPVNRISFEDYQYHTPMGYRLPRLLRRYAVKRFHFFGLCGPEIMLGTAVVDLGYLRSGFLSIYDRKTGKMHEYQKTTFLSTICGIGSSPENPHSWLKGSELILDIQGDRVLAECNEAKLSANLRAGHGSPVRLCTRAGYTGWSYTQKTMPVHVSAEMMLEGHRRTLSSPEYMGVMDWSGGYMRRHTFWNWAAAACRLSSGADFGLNLSCGTNETSFTENAFWVDDKRENVDTVHFDYDSNDLLRPWRMTSSDGKVDLLFYPERRRGERKNALVLASSFTQLVGAFQGSLMTREGKRIEVDNCYGWTEDHYAKW